MARVIGNPFGELRGKLAGSVFSRSRAGAIVREYVKPVNPNSIRQLASRAMFRASSQGWTGLTQLEQGSWNLFATAIYNPLQNTNNGQFTGNQSFVAIKNAIANAQGNTFDTTWTVVGPIAPPVFVPGAFKFDNVAPASSLVGNIAQTAGPAVTFQIDTIEISADLEVKCNLLLLGTLPGGLAANSLIDTNGNLFTFAVYISDPVRTLGGRPKNDFYLRLGNAEIGTFAVPPLEDATKIKFAYDAGVIQAQLKSSILEGQIYKVTIVGVSEVGTQVVIASAYTTIVA